MSSLARVSFLAVHWFPLSSRARASLWPDEGPLFDSNFLPQSKIAAKGAPFRAPQRSGRFCRGSTNQSAKNLWSAAVFTLRADAPLFRRKPVHPNARDSRVRLRIPDKRRPGPRSGSQTKTGKFISGRRRWPLRFHRLPCRRAPDRAGCRWSGHCGSKRFRRCRRTGTRTSLQCRSYRAEQYLRLAASTE
jgi:hypothetical protein